ncbi:MAG: aldehyde ferredoxin oxidoreductase family protein [Candidatus Jordarchaeum sp.]|uniref:aldehyde ferredoxin oxidoreductase family protein n=1 Tax=Candidatus Jordarchaeum sp. TaxID=2823881 RepID=UPI00404AD6AC
MGGYLGKILRVNLSKSKITTEEFKEEVQKKYLGGSGLAAKILYDELKPGIDPLGPENKLVFATGPLTGTRVPSSGRHLIAAKSPLTGIWGEATSGGFWGAELKFAGFDAIVVEGKSEKPIYLWIKNGEAELKDAGKIWGKNVYQTEDIIRESLGDSKIIVSSIGPAGEKLVKIACIMNDKDRAAGRCGLGAVMGSKKLKAIAVRGTQEIPVEDPEKLNENAKKFREALKANFMVEGVTNQGTNSATASLNMMGTLPTQYYREGVFDQADKIDGNALQQITTKRFACYGCPVACGRGHVEVKTGPYAGTAGAGPEYETVAAFGSLCMNSELGSIVKAGIICNQLGIDTISAGNIVAFAMECYEKGILTDKETEGLKLNWGNHEALVKLVEKMGMKEGIGETLSEGVRNASKKLGKGSEKFAMHVKGLETPLHEPKGYKGLGLGYATSNRGACHLRPAPQLVEMLAMARPELGFDKVAGAYDVEGKGYVIKGLQDFKTTVDSLVLCSFIYDLYAYLPNESAEMVTAATGYEMEVGELVKIGERIFNLKRLFNVREGVSRKDDTLPKRFLEEKTTKGPTAGQTVELEPMLNEYYAARGWDDNGIPTKKKLSELGL